VHKELTDVRRKADKYAEAVSELEGLQVKFEKVTIDAERQKERVEEKARAQILSLQKESERLVEKSEKLQAAEDAVRVCALLLLSPLLRVLSKSRIGLLCPVPLRSRTQCKGVDRVSYLASNKATIG
jgi:hypothetical protein